MEAAIAEARREKEEKRKEKHRRMEEERERMRQDIRNKVTSSAVYSRSQDISLGL